MHNTVINLLVLAVLIIMFFYLFPSIIERIEIQECYKWVSQSEEYPKFYLINWQKKQCDAHNIYIDAPVID